METKWLAAAGVAAVMAFAGALYMATPAEEVVATKSDIKAPSLNRTKTPGGAAGAASKARKAGGHAKSKTKAKAGKGAKSKSAKGAKGAKSKSKARPADPAQAAQKWAEIRGAVADGMSAKLDAYATEKGWDDAKKGGVQKLLDDTLVRIDDASAKIAAGEWTPEQASSEYQKLRSDVARQLVETVGASDAQGLVQSLKADKGAKAGKGAKKAPPG